MSEPSYRPRHNVSRQFTDAELAVSDRTTDHLTQQVDQMPAPRLSSAVTGDVAYGWLEEDLKRRDEQTTRLAREMQLAEQQSLRKQLDAEAREETDMKSAAADGIAKISQWEGKFGSMEEAKQALLKERPDYASNPDFNIAYANLSKDFKTPRQREMEKIEEDTRILRGGLELVEAEAMDTWVRSNPGELEKMVNATQNTKMLGAMSAEQEAILKQQTDRLSYEESARMQRRFGMAEGGNAELELQQKSALKSSGLNVMQPGRLQQFFPPGGTAMLMTTDMAYIKTKLDDEKRTTLETNLNILTNPKSSEDDKFVAKDVVDDFASDYLIHSSELKKDLERREAINSALKESSQSFEDGVKANISVLKAYGDQADADPFIPIGAIVENSKNALTLMKTEFIAKNIPLVRLSEAVKKIDALSKLEAEKASGDKQKENNLDLARRVSREANQEIRAVLEDAATAERTVDSFKPSGTLRAGTSTDWKKMATELGKSAPMSKVKEWVKKNGIDPNSIPK